MPDAPGIIDSSFGTYRLNTRQDSFKVDTLEINSVFGVLILLEVIVPVLHNPPQTAAGLATGLF